MEIKSEKLKDLLTVAEAARLMDVARETVYITIYAGRLPDLHVLGKRVLPRSAVLEYLARTRPDGVKPRGRPLRADAPESARRAQEARRAKAEELNRRAREARRAKREARQAQQAQQAQQALQGREDRENDTQDVTP